MLAADYAKALYDLAPKPDVLPKLRVALRARRHEKLLPQILAEYQKLIVHEKRLAMHRATTPEAERTRTLFELYKKLIHTQGVALALWIL